MLLILFGGIGPDYLQDAHVIYLQLLAGPGLIGFLGFFLLIGWALRSALRMRQHALFAAAGASLACSWWRGSRRTRCWRGTCTCRSG